MNHVFVIDGNPHKTFTIESENAPQAIPDEHIRVDGALPSSALITIEGNPVRISFGGDAVDPRETGHFFDVQDVFTLHNAGAIRSLRFASANAGNAGTLRITMGF